MSDIIASKSLKDILSQFFPMRNDIVEDVEKHARLVKVKKGETVIQQGELCNSIVLNKRGLFRVFYKTDDREDTILFGASGDVFTSLNSFHSGKPSFFSLAAVAESEVWLISYPEWSMLEERHPELIRWMRDLCLLQINGFESRYAQYQGRSAESRFYRFLEKSPRNLPIPSVKLLTRLVPLKYLASYLTISKWTLSRLRNKLVRDGNLNGK